MSRVSVPIAQLVVDVPRSSLTCWGIGLRSCRSAVAALALLLSMASVANALSVTLQWDSNNDGVTAGYRVYYRTASGTYQPASGIDVGNVTQFRADLQSGQTYYFAVRAYSSTAVLGPASTELSFTVPLASISRSTLAFGAVNSGGTLTTKTGSQAVTVSAGTTWLATTTTPWLQVSGGSGTGNGQFTVSVVGVPGLPASGTVVGAVTVTSGASPPQTVPVSLTLYGSAATAPPVGSFDTPATGAQVAGSIAVTGWALDDIEVSRVEIWRDTVPGETTRGFNGAGPGRGKVFVANASFVNGARPDVESRYATVPFAYRAGWGYLMLTRGLWNQGNGTFTLYAFAYDKDGRSSTLGSKVITSNNATATKPFGGIDSPGYGETISGTVWNFGWALTPNASPSCAVASVQVAIDSGPLMPVSYGDTRADIAAGFPGFTNGSGAGGAYLLDTTALSNGAHQIGWFVTDTCGRADGIGSRFFNVLNGSSSMGAAATPAGWMADARPSDRRVAVEPVDVRRGSESTPVFPGAQGTRVVSIAQGERVEVRLPGIEGAPYAGYQIVNGERRPLPLGSSLDAASGIFYWQPAASFLGLHDLDFVTAAGDVVRVRVVIGTAVQSAIDLPAPNTAVHGPFIVAGWALDLAATTGSGVDAVHVWAYPLSGAAPTFLGAASYGDVRPDIGGLFGDQFAPASYYLPVSHLAPGEYDLVVYPHSAVIGDFQGARVVRVRVKP